MSDEQIDRLLLALAVGLLVTGFAYATVAGNPNGGVLAMIGTAVLLAYLAHRVQRFGWARFWPGRGKP